MKKCILSLTLALVILMSLCVSAFAAGNGSQSIGPGNICQEGDFQIGLTYVKRMSELPTALGNVSDNISADNEVILAFFEFYNGSSEPKTVHPEDITCYVDGIQTSDVESYIKIECDGIKQYHGEEILGHAQLMSVEDFEAPIGWNELKFFYGTNCVWTVHQEDVHSENFTKQSLFSDKIVDVPITEPETVVYADEYEIVFQGASLYEDDNIFDDVPQYYVIFKFRINNTGSTLLDYEFVGYNMTAYKDCSFIGEASYSLNEKIDNYTNVFDVDSIQPGMSANIYAAFECSGETGTYSMLYDSGYIFSDEKALIHAAVE